MGNAYKRVRAGAALVALYAGWHLTSGLHRTVFRMHTPPAAAATAATIITSQCSAPPAGVATSPSATPTASPAPTSAAPQLCLSVQAGQDSVVRGKTATWTIQVSDQGAPATAVSITIAGDPAGLTPVFTGSCPSGGGTSTCTLGDMGTAVTPSSYQLQAQIAVPQDTTAGNLGLAATADSSSLITTAPTAAQTITITSAAPAAKPSHTPAPSPGPTTAPATRQPTQPPTAAAAQLPPLPVIQPTTAPAIGTLPTATPVATTVPPVSISSALPQITPVVTTVPAPAASIASSPAANIQAIGSPPATAASDSFSLSIGMPGRTAQILGYILLALVITLILSKLITSYFTRTRQPRQNQPALAAGTNPSRHGIKLPCLRLSALRLPRPRLSHIHVPHRRHRPRPTRAERAAIREQNWQHHLENQKNAKAVEADQAPAEVPIPEAGYQAMQPDTGPLTPVSVDLLPDSPRPR
jgi:hypothetical protein